MDFCIDSFSNFEVTSSRTLSSSSIMDMALSNKVVASSEATTEKPADAVPYTVLTWVPMILLWSLVVPSE